MKANPGKEPTMRSLYILTVAALAGTNVAAADGTATPPVAKKVVGQPGITLPMLPDLKITAKPTNGIGPVFDFLIENIGKAPSKEASIRFHAMPPCKHWKSESPQDIGSGKLILEGRVKALVVTTSQSYATSHSVEMPSAWRGCQLRATVDPEHALAELSNDNNAASIETHNAPRPDLVVSFNSETRKILVQNKGHVPAGASILFMQCHHEMMNTAGHDFYPCDIEGHQKSKAWTFNVPALAAFQDHLIQSPIQNNGGIKIHVDANDQVKESDEDNNFWPPKPYGE